MLTAATPGSTTLVPVAVLDVADELPTGSMSLVPTSTTAAIPPTTTNTTTHGPSEFWQSAAARFSGELHDWRRLAQYLLAQELTHQVRYAAMEQLHRKLVEEKTYLRKSLESSQDSLRRLMELK